MSVYAIFQYVYQSLGLFNLFETFLHKIFFLVSNDLFPPFQNCLQGLVCLKPNGNGCYKLLQLLCLACQIRSGMAS